MISTFFVRNDIAGGEHIMDAFWRISLFLGIETMHRCAFKCNVVPERCRADNAI